MDSSIDLTRVLKGVSSGWVAMSSDYKRIVAKASGFQPLLKKVRDLPQGSVILMTVVKSFRNILLVQPVWNREIKPR